MGSHAEAIKRDRNHSFKFHVGDRVVKRWWWRSPKESHHDVNNNVYCRDGGDSEDFPMGTTGTISQMDSDGKIVILRDDKAESWNRRWGVGASELDLLPSEEE